MGIQKDVVEAKTFKLLIKIMQDESLQDFYLVGGTSLALQIGHRKSIDLDLVTPKPFNPEDLRKTISKNYNFVEQSSSNGTLLGAIDNIKVDMIHYDYPLVKPLVITDEQIRMASMEDISAMKMVAISNSGERLKDFVDLSYLSTHFSFNQMKGFYREKYPTANVVVPERALVFHDEIDFSKNVSLTNKKFSWKPVRDRLFDMPIHPDRVYPTYPGEKILTDRKQTKNDNDPDLYAMVTNRAERRKGWGDRGDKWLACGDELKEIVDSLAKYPKPQRESAVREFLGKEGNREKVVALFQEQQAKLNDRGR